MIKQTIEELRKIKEVMIGYDDFTQDDLYTIDKAIIACEQLRKARKKAKRWKRKYLNYAEQEPCENHEEKPHSLLDAYFRMRAEQEPSRDIKEIAEIMKCDANAETKCKMISNILTAKPHYFVEQVPCEDKMYFEYMRGFDKGRESVKPCNDAISRQAVLKTLDDTDNVLDEDRTIENYKELLKECYEVLPSVQPKRQTYTEDELKEFADGISLRLCSLKSAEYWGGKYTEQIAWLEQLDAKVKADMRGGE